MCNGLISKILLFIITFALWISGIILIVFGSIGLSDPRKMIEILTITPGMQNIVDIIDVGPLLEGVSIFMIVLGSLLFLFGWVGCHGALNPKRKLPLLIFSFTLIFAIVAEVALIIYASVYPGTASQYIQDEMYNSLTTYDTETINSTNGAVVFSQDTTSSGWQNLQSMTHCCGAGSEDANGYIDYETLKLNANFNYTYNSISYHSLVPPTCCMTTLTTGDALKNASEIADISSCLNSAGPGSASFWSQSCWKGVEEMMYNYNYISIITCACLIAAELFAVILVFKLRNDNK